MENKTEAYKPTSGQKNIGADAPFCNITTENSATDTPKKVYRTKHKAEGAAEIPDRLPVITNHIYQYALTFYPNSNAYLQPLSDISKTEYSDGILKFNGLPATSSVLNSIYMEEYESMGSFNLPLLKALYGIILTMVSDSSSGIHGNDDLITIYYPVFSTKIGKSPHISRNDVKDCINSIRLFQSVVGIINNGTNGKDILPVISSLEYDPDKNTISFSSPYMMRIIKDIYESSIRKDKRGNILRKKNGAPQMFPSYSYLVDMSIVKEKNRKAVEIVFIVVTLIEQAGNNIPHITAKLIVERNPALHKSLDGQPSGIKSLFLKRAFTKAWELLRTKTALPRVYKNIQLPDPDNVADIPTASTLNKLFEFTHEGKNKNT